MAGGRAEGRMDLLGRCVNTGEKKVADFMERIIGYLAYI